MDKKNYICNLLKADNAMEENYKDEMIVIDNVNRYNEIFRT